MAWPPPLLVMGTAHVALFLITASVVSASNSNISQSQGCNLIIPQEVKLSFEPHGEPLLIHVHMRIIAIREVTDNDHGGSFGVDIG